MNSARLEYTYRLLWKCPCKMHDAKILKHNLFRIDSGLTKPNSLDSPGDGGGQRVPNKQITKQK